MKLSFALFIIDIRITEKTLNNSNALVPVENSNQLLSTTSATPITDLVNNPFGAITPSSEFTNRKDLHQFLLFNFINQETESGPRRK
ncbi:hypothetical protein DERP_006258 [Dermatophagoides pteronyssinus]|uniref:Uncharacterized protein n=1 Tax=Dermatophagoides pteronyssinus TaxID=6956 RepID=A0ABQ8IXY9_DERPT|nr:hypothetical protein DERP_006258 [Dermatophagoides pteronyssinus]